VTSLAAVVSAASGSANDITPGALGFVVVAAMGVVLFFLLRSMTKHLRRVRAVRDAGLEPGSKLDIEAGSQPRRGPVQPGQPGSDPSQPGHP
jgi:hypothetical protein